MNIQELVKANKTAKRISLKDLYSIIQHPQDQFLKYSGDEQTIVIENYVIEQETLFLDNRIELDKRLTFENCYFISKGIFFLSGIVCNNYLTFDDCHFSGAIYITEGKFVKELTFKLIHANSIHISGGIFEKILISGYGLQEIFVMGGKFDTLDLETYIGDDDIGKLTIFQKGNNLGNINISNKNFDEIFIYGSTKNSTYNFNNIKCDHVHISNVVNDGSLNFFGIEPKNLVGEDLYFQITNSNLNKAQFYRVNFSLYKELIIIDSFIAECLFIACRWKNNIRALKGPGYQEFKETLKNGRKINKEELFAIKEAYRQLRVSMNKHSDKIQEARFYSKEMNIHNSTLKWTWPWRNSFWDKVILYLSKVLGDYGNSFLRPLFFLLFGHLLLFFFALLLDGFQPLHISFDNPTAHGFRTAFEKYFVYINPLRRLETSLPGYLIVLDLLMRILASYMIYNIVRASRRFIS